MRSSARRAAAGSSTLVLVVLAAGALAAGIAIGRATMKAPAPPADPPVVPPTVVPARQDSAPGSAGQSQDDARGARRRPPTSELRSVPMYEGPQVWAFEPAELDFGIVPLGAPMKGEIKLRNVSSEPLRILTMKPDCKCTTLEDLSGTVIAPGESVTIGASVESRAYPSEASSVIKFLFDQYGLAEYRLRAVISRTVQATPSFLQLEDARSGTVQVSAVDEKPFSILSTGGAAPVFADGFRPGVDAPRSKYELAWDFSGYDAETCENPRGERMPLWWVIETDHPSSPLIDLRVRHYPCTMLDVPHGGRLWFTEENRVVIDTLPEGSTHEFVVHLKWLRDARPDDTIREVRSLSPRLAAELVSTDREGDEISFRVKVAGAPGARGVIYAPVLISGYKPGHAQRFWVIARAIDPVSG